MAKETTAKTGDAATTTPPAAEVKEGRAVELKEVKALGTSAQHYGAKLYKIEAGKTYKFLPEVAEHFRKQGLVF